VGIINFTYSLRADDFLLHNVCAIIIHFLLVELQLLLPQSRLVSDWRLNFTFVYAWKPSLQVFYLRLVVFAYLRTLCRLAEGPLGFKLDHLSVLSLQLGSALVDVALLLDYVFVY
jgi:hypothetical protein